MKSKGYLTSTIKLSLWLLFACSLFAIIYPIFQRAAENQHPSSCQGNLKQIALGISQYLQDYDGRYPRVSVNETTIDEDIPYGWADTLRPYLKSTQIFQCPSEITVPLIATSGPLSGQAVPTAKGYIDYWFNARLDGLESKEVETPSSTLLHGDGSDGTDATNARYSLSELPAAWRNSAGSRVMRHLDGANYSFTDGHVKWLKPDGITTKTPDGKNATFAVK